MDEPLPGMPEPPLQTWVSGFAMGGYGVAEGLPEDTCVLEIVFPFSALERKSLNDLNSPDGRTQLAAMLLLGEEPMILTSQGTSETSRGTLVSFAGIDGFDPRPLRGQLVRVDNQLCPVIAVEVFMRADPTGLPFGLLLGSKAQDKA